MLSLAGPYPAGDNEVTTSRSREKCGVFLFVYTRTVTTKIFCVQSKLTLKLMIMSLSLGHVTNAYRFFYASIIIKVKLDGMVDQRALSLTCR